VRLSDLAARLGCAVRGDAEADVVRIAGIERAGPGDLTFLAGPRYASHLQRTRAAAVIVTPDVETSLPCLLAKNPYLLYARAARILHPAARPDAGVHPSAQVHPSARLADGVHVGPLAVIGPRTRVGARTVVHAHAVVYEDVEIGDDCVLHSGVHVREACRLGNRVVIQNGAIIGADGFGFARSDDGEYEKIPQLGNVVIEDDVEIGALTAVDRASLHETRIGRGTKLDNLVQIGHSVSVGPNTVMAAQAGVAGSTSIGGGVMLGGQVGVAGHLTIGDGVVATAQSGIPSSVDAGKMISGYPAIDNRAWLKASAVFGRLPELQRRLRQVEAKIEEFLKPDR
jgi:UDP-3-O-[3-hydroxymyristoyl] glucosamine N-acyltransferase